MVIRAFLSPLVAALLLTGCATMAWGEPEPVVGAINTYKFRMGVNAYSMVLSESADKDVIGEIEKVKVAQKFTGHKIIDRRFNAVPSYYEYTVLFKP
jgi:hypothetical protein